MRLAFSNYPCACSGRSRGQPRILVPPSAFFKTVSCSLLNTLSRPTNFPWFPCLSIPSHGRSTGIVNGVGRVLCLTSCGLWGFKLKSSCSHVKCLRETLERGSSIGSRFQKFQQLGRLAPLLLVCGEAGHLGTKAWSRDRKLNRKQRQNTLHRHTPATHSLKASLCNNFIKGWIDQQIDPLVGSRYSLSSHEGSQ